MKIKLKAEVLAIKQPASNESLFAVTLDCGQPFKTFTAPKIAPQLVGTSFSRPLEGLLIMQVFGQPTVNVGDLVPVEIEPA
jgi:hypothetical protein